MAFAKTPKQIRNGIVSVIFKIGLKSQILKNQKFVGSCPTPLFCLSCNMPGIKPRSTAKLPTTLTSNLKPNTQVKECHLFMYKKSFRSAELGMVNSHFPMLKIRFPDISSPKT